MVTEDQSDVVTFLESPAAHGGAPVERVDTHASIVFLSGGRALKLKRAVRYDYLDFSTAEKRRAMCEAELRVNVRTAPAIYRAVTPVTRAADGVLALGGAGVAVDWVLEMARFDQAFLLDRLAERGELALEAMAPLARTIARFHAAAGRRVDRGGAAAMLRVVEGDEAAFLEEGGGVLDPDTCRRVTQASLQAIERHRLLLDQRRDIGLVRECHGDLHLRNIVLLNGAPTPFDAIEFNDHISCVDVAYDLAFLLMDLWHRRLPRHANAVWNGYLAETGDVDALPLLPLFLSCRAGIRAMTSVTAASLASSADARATAQRVAQEYLELADLLLRPARARLVAIGGPSGSGKSTLAHALAPGVGPVPGAVVVRSDEVRKRLSGVDRLTRLDSSSYTLEMSRRVYAALVERATQILARGHSAIVDAVFLQPPDRQALEEAAAAAGIPFVGVWLDAPEDVLVSRIEGRRGDASDADAAVVRAQLSQHHGPIGWHRLQAGAGPQAVAAAAAELLGGALGPG